MLRRALRYGSLAALWVDMLLLTPVALGILAAHGGIIGPLLAYPRLLALVPLLGLLSSVALVCYVSASRHRSEEHTSELQSLMRISYAVFCLKKKKTNNKSI